MFLSPCCGCSVTCFPVLLSVRSQTELFRKKFWINSKRSGLRLHHSCNLLILKGRINISRYWCEMMKCLLKVKSVFESIKSEMIIHSTWGRFPKNNEISAFTNEMSIIHLYLKWIHSFCWQTFTNFNFKHQFSTWTSAVALNAFYFLILLEGGLIYIYLFGFFVIISSLLRRHRSTPLHREADGTI